LPPETVARDHKLAMLAKALYRIHNAAAYLSESAELLRMIEMHEDAAAVLNGMIASIQCIAEEIKPPRPIPGEQEKLSL
jgi:hypothetical protein